MALSFKTARLNVSELTDEITEAETFALLTQIPSILTPRVVKSLPAHFHGIESQLDAKRWLERMLAESRLLTVSYHHDEPVIGFVFVYVETEDASNDDIQVHVGYLLAQTYWRQGLASELLQGLIKQASQISSWRKLIAGVDPANNASSELLIKLGFSKGENQVPAICYEYLLD